MRILIGWGENNELFLSLNKVSWPKIEHLIFDIELYIRIPPIKGRVNFFNVFISSSVDGEKMVQSLMS